MNHEEEERELSKIAADKYSDHLSKIAKHTFTNEDQWDEFHDYTDGFYAADSKTKLMWTILNPEEDIAYVFVEPTKVGFAKIKEMISNLPPIKTADERKKIETTAMKSIPGCFKAEVLLDEPNCYCYVSKSTPENKNWAGKTIEGIRIYLIVKAPKKKKIKTK